MKKVPKYVKKYLCQIQKHVRIAGYFMGLVDDWLIKNGLSPEDLRDGSGNGLDDIEYGSGDIECLCRRLENMMKKG